MAGAVIRWNEAPSAKWYLINSLYTTHNSGTPAQRPAKRGARERRCPATRGGRGHWKEPVQTRFNRPVRWNKGSGTDNKGVRHVRTSGLAIIPPEPGWHERQTSAGGWSGAGKKAAESAVTGRIAGSTTTSWRKECERQSLAEFAESGFCVTTVFASPAAGAR